MTKAQKLEKILEMMQVLNELMKDIVNENKTNKVINFTLEDESGLRNFYYED